MSGRFITQLYSKYMKSKFKSVSVLIILVLFATSWIPNASAAKVGSACKMLNAKGWDGNTPIICKKNSKNKLVWSKFSPSNPTSSTYSLSIRLVKYYDTLQNSNSNSVNLCTAGGLKYTDVIPTTPIEIRDGSGNLIATSTLGSPTVEDIVNPNSFLTMGNCVYMPTIKLKVADFYQVKIGSRYSNSFSLSDLAAKGWKIELALGQ